jgi:hypothetical protein
MPLLEYLYIEFPDTEVWRNENKSDGEIFKCSDKDWFRQRSITGIFLSKIKSASLKLLIASESFFCSSVKSV